MDTLAAYAGDTVEKGDQTLPTEPCIANLQRGDKVAFQDAYYEAVEMAETSDKHLVKTS